MNGKIPDVNSLERGQIGSLALMKAVLSGKHLNIKSEKKRKKKLCEAAKKLTGLYDKNNAELSELFSSGDYDRIFEFLSACEKNEEEYNRALRLENLAGAPEDKERDLSLLSLVIYESIFLAREKDCLRLTVYCNSFLLCYKITTRDAPEKDLGRIRFSNRRAPVSFDNETGLYCISYCYCDGDTDGERMTNLIFSDFELTITPVNVFTDIPPDPFIYGAYGYISVAAWYILKKKALDINALNERETGLLPLLSELSDLIHGERKMDAYPEFEKILTAHNAKKAHSHLQKVKGSAKRREKAVSRLLLCLGSSENEPVWRQIYNSIYDSQKDYPLYSDIVFPKEKFDNFKRKTDNIMRKLGYDGVYPEYTKKGSIKGFHLVSAQTGGGLIFPSDDVSFFVKCHTLLDAEGEFSVPVYSGFAVNTKKRQARDIISCMFCGGSAVTEIYTDKLEKTLELAAKFAECQKLTKEEKKYVNYKFNAGAIVILCMTAGGLWSALFNLVFIPLFFLMVKLMGDYTTFSEFINDMPIFQMFLFGWIGFGGLMSLFMIFFRKR